MNTYMWNHPLTEKHLDVLKNTLGYQIIDPISKTLACGDVGVGAMAETGHIVKFVHSILEPN
jgi:phosphopantothenoylcysteine decarboxylase